VIYRSIPIAREGLLLQKGRPMFTTEQYRAKL
jgi:hypothetical protein